MYTQKYIFIPKNENETKSDTGFGYENKDNFFL